MSVLPPPPKLPACERCGKQAVQRVGGLYYCGRHGEEELRGAPCRLSDCVRRGGHPLHMTADERVWHEPVLGDVAGDMLVVAHVYRHDELRAGRANRAALELTASGLIEPVMENRFGVYALTAVGRAVADLRIRRRMAEAEHRMRAASPQEPVQAGQAESLL